MDRLLASTLSGINGLLAVVIILVGAGLGQGFFGEDVVGLIFGLFIGIAAAGLICGTIAFLALIEKHLRVIAAGVSAPREGNPARRLERIEPAL